MSELIIRDLTESDLSNGFLDTLKSLTDIGCIDNSTAKHRFHEIKSHPNYIIKIAEIDGKVVATATLFIELKFIHGLGCVGHIEDVVTDKKFQCQGIGKKIIYSLLQEAKKRGCYKTLLDCDDKLISFYKGIKLDGIQFYKHGICMRFDHV